MSSSRAPHLPTAGNRLRVGDWHVDLTAGTLSAGDEVVRLEPKIRDVLACLIEAEGAVVSKDALLERAWPDTVVEEAALSRCISELRRALGDDAKQPRYIETLPKRGYRLTAEVARHTPPPASRLSLISPWVVAAALVVIVLASSTYRRWIVPTEARSIRAVAVLPVENLTGDEGQDVFAEGITDGLITELGRIRVFDRVTSRYSTVGLDAGSSSMARIGDLLDVDGIVEASMLSIADAVRLNVRLVHAPSDSQVWSGSFEGGPSDIARLYGEVARALVRGIGLAVPGEETPPPERAVDPAAHAAYVRGRHFWSQRTPEGYRRAAEYFRQAIDIDPEYAAAYAGMADNFFMAEEPTRAVAAKDARNYAAIALSLDDSLADAHTTMAFISVFDWQWQAAEERFVKAIELNPSYVTAHHWYGLLLTWLSRFDEAEAHLLRARELDPLSPLLVSAHASVSNNAGRFERAIRIGEEALALDPTFWGARNPLATAHAALGQHDAAIAHAEAMVAASASLQSRSVLARTYAAAGRDADVERILAEFEALGDAAWLEQDLTLDVAEIYAAWGEPERAFEYLQRAYAEGSDNIVTIAVTAWLRNLRDDPRFDDLLRRIGLRE